MRRFLLFPAFLSVILGALPGCVGQGAISPGAARELGPARAAQASEPISGSRFLLDTFCSITLYGPPDGDLVSRALDLCGEYEALFSVSAEGGDIWRVNHAGGEPVEVSPRTADVVAAGIEYGYVSGGRFDITVGRLTELWDFSQGSAVPNAEDIDEARETVDYRGVAVAGDTVRLLDSGARLDLGGIAKGYIADRLADYLVDGGVTGAIVDLGGNVVAIGERQDGKDWRIAVRSPFGGYGEYFGIIETGAASIVTAGVYERSFESGGELYHHILDPFTGYPARTDIVSATVITETSMSGDALSTMLILAGSEKAEGLLQGAEGFAGALLIKDDGEYIIIGNLNFEKL